MVLLNEARLTNSPVVLVFLLIAENSFSGIFGLKLLSLHVPPVVKQGDSVWLNCTLDLELDELYSVKWYKNDVEFYRYLPRDKPSAQTYNVPGIYVDLRKSSQGNVFMHTTDLSSEGMYRCEASAESPTFQTVEGQKYMIIYVLPKRGPVIRNNQPRYNVGDVVNVTCRSGPSKPAAEITWYINGEKAPLRYVTDLVTTNHTDGLFSSSRGILFVGEPYHTKSSAGSINLRCVATVSQSYSMSSEEVIVGSNALDDGHSGVGVSSADQFHNQEGPFISGGHRRYSVGDILKMNCSSTKQQEAPELQWYLNDEQVSSLNVIKYPTRRYPDGKETATLGLQFIVTPGHFDERSEMRLKCTATLSQVIHTRSDESTVGGNHRNSGLQVSENIGKVLQRSSGATQQTVCLLMLSLTVLYFIRFL